MSYTDTVHHDGRVKRDDVRPLSLLVLLMRENPSARDARLRSIFKARIQEEVYDEHLDRLFDEWLDLNFNNARRTAFPPNEDELKARHAAREAQKWAQAKAEDRIADGIAKLVLLDLVMPNGKPLRECTGADCASFGGWCRAIEKTIGPSGIVGKALTENDLQEMWTKAAK